MGYEPLDELTAYRHIESEKHRISSERPEWLTVDFLPNALANYTVSQQHRLIPSERKEEQAQASDKEDEDLEVVHHLLGIVCKLRFNFFHLPRRKDKSIEYRCLHTAILFVDLLEGCTATV